MGETMRSKHWSASILGTPDNWPVSLRTLVQMVLGSPVATVLIWGDQWTCFYNDAFYERSQQSGRSLSPLGDLAVNTWILQEPKTVLALESVMATGRAVTLPENAVDDSAIVEESYTLSAVTGDDGQVAGVLITWAKTAANSMEAPGPQSILDGEARLRSLVESAPFPIGVYVGPDMHIQLVNQSIIDVWGKGPDVIGKRYAEVLPELAGKGIYEQLASVYNTGKAFHAHNQRVDLEVGGVLHKFYFKYSFTPLFDGEGNVYGVMNTAADVTDLVLAQQELQQAQVSLRGAVELAQLGSWELDLVTGSVSYSDNIKAWFGFGQDHVELDEVYNPIHPDDRRTVETAVAQALAPGSSGSYDAEYRLIDPFSGSHRYVHARGKVISDTDGTPYKLVGTAQDVTTERQRQYQLEELVQQRTVELEALNEELAGQNEEYLAVNEELEEANRLLMLSNENLEQFAYAASHDLQEPLRKIRQFTDLVTRNNPGLNVRDFDHLERVLSAAQRMSVLIEDLLDFSSIKSGPTIAERVSLHSTLATVLLDLDLVIAETNAQIQTDHLPEIHGNAVQLSQLFRNLLSNALKFRKPGTAPLIQVRYSELSHRQLPESVKPVRKSEMYELIEVIDNGIGFEQQYLSRIFQVFQRLHSKSQYKGTGIGLAICEKVVTNHGGAITAISQPGEGARFQIYFPRL